MMLSDIIQTFAREISVGMVIIGISSLFCPIPEKAKIVIVLLLLVTYIFVVAYIMDHAYKH